MCTRLSLIYSEEKKDFLRAPSLESLWGYAFGTSPLRLFHHEDIVHLFNEINSAVKIRDMVDSEIRVHAPHGEYSVASIKIQPLFNDSKYLGYVLHVYIEAPEQPIIAFQGHDEKRTFADLIKDLGFGLFRPTNPAA